jgi:hypothetical protein
LEVFIPKNTLAMNKRIIVVACVSVAVQLPNQVGGPSYQESYSLNGVPVIARDGNLLITAIPSVSAFMVDRSYHFDSISIIEDNWTGGPTHNALSHVNGVLDQIPIPGVAGPIDPSVNNTIGFNLKTSFVGSTDTVQTVWGQAYIQSPLDLARIGL